MLMATKIDATVGFLLLLTLASCLAIDSGRQLTSSGGKLSGGASAGGGAGSFVRLIVAFLAG
eukprot:gene1276-1616_t